MPTIKKAPSIVDRLHGYHDADNDTVPGLPIVTWADSQLLELIEILLNEVLSLKEKINQLENSK